MRLTQTAVALLALSAWVVDPALTGPADAHDDAALGAGLAQPSPMRGPDTNRAFTEDAQGVASPAVESGADDSQYVYVGDFYGMMIAYDGFGPAKAVLDEVCATQAPGLILAVYRPGDVGRDAWCVARYGDVEEFLTAAGSIGDQLAPRRQETSHD